MLLILRKIPFISLCFLVLGARSEAEPAYWVFEGVITKSDSRLVPDLQSGWVLSGSFVMDALAMSEEWIDESARSGRFSGGITDAEITVDLYHQLHFEAMQVPGLAGFDYQDNDPDEEGRDLYGWYFPLRGALKDSPWSSRWLQIWLSDTGGEMIKVFPPAISPYGIEWKAAWFRLTFDNPQGEVAYVDGRIEYFGPATGHEKGEEDDWITVATDLSRQLVERDNAIADLRDELASARARIESLRKMVDLLMVERQNLEKENALLEEKAEQADPEIVKTMASLTAEKVLIQEELSVLAEQNESLEERLSESERERMVLQGRMAVTQQRLSDAEEAAQRAESLKQETSTAVLEAPQAEELRPATAIEARSEGSLSGSASRGEQQVVPEQDQGSDDAEGISRLRRFGPRKFR